MNFVLIKVLLLKHQIKRIMTTQIAINTKFNTVETIYNQNPLDSKGFMEALVIFAAQAKNYSDNESFVSRKSAEEVSICFDKAKNTNEPYMIYTYANAAEIWLSKAWNNAD